MNWLTAAPYLIVAGLGLGGVAYLYEKGKIDERNGNAARVLVEADEARRLRERTDAGERSRSDDDALGCLRNPSGCR